MPFHCAKAAAGSVRALSASRKCRLVTATVIVKETERLQNHRLTFRRELLTFERKCVPFSRCCTHFFGHSSVKITRADKAECSSPSLRGKGGRPI